jgi:hypothetical protein
MIDSNHLVYGSVILMFLVGALIVAVAGMLLLGVGFTVAMTVRFRKRRMPPKMVIAKAPQEEDVVRKVTWEASISHLSEDQDCQGRETGRAAGLPLVVNSVCREKCPVGAAIPGLRR